MRVFSQAARFDKGTLKIVAVLMWLGIMPTAAFAQGSIAGVAKDTVGMPVAAVTVEAASPVLIEGKRTVLTNASGEYEIVNLVPGTYTVTFSGNGFLTVKVEGVLLEGTATVTTNGTLQKGTAEGVQTVAQVQTVDVRSAGTNTVVNDNVINNIPTSRVIGQSAAAVEPSIAVAGATTSTYNGMGSVDSGGAGGDASAGSVSAHGSTEVQIKRAGLLAQGTSAYTTNPAFYAQQVSEAAGATGEAAIGGVKTGLVPKDGGNTFRGSFFGAYAPSAWQQSNLTSTLQAEGLLSENTIKRSNEENPGFGGPLVKNRLWFYVAVRQQIADNWVAGAFADPYQLNPNIFYDPNNRLNPAKDLPLLTVPQFDSNTTHVGELQVTFQATPRNKFSLTESTEHWCTCPSYISANQSSGVYNIRGQPYYYHELQWTSVVTRRLLVDAAVKIEPYRGGYYPSFWYPAPLGGQEPNHPPTSIYSGANPPDSWLYSSGFNANAYPQNLVPFTESTTGVGSKLWNGPYNRGYTHYYGARAAASYVTGTHSFKVGFEDYWSNSDTINYTANPIPYRYTLTNDVPTSITIYNSPYETLSAVNASLGIFAQDKWTLRKFTVTGGLRFDYYKSSFPALHVGPTVLAPNNNINFPDTPDVQGWKDLSPRVGIVYDVFGNGKTALRASLSRYVVSSGSGQLSPAGNMVNSTTRSWKDTNPADLASLDFIPVCDLTNPVANGQCGTDQNTNFGKEAPSQTYDPSLLSGWGKRNYDWEFSVSGTHQLLPRLAVNVGYFRRWFGNQLTTENLAVAASDYSQYSVTAPTNSGLPGGGGYTLSGLYNLNPNKFGVPVQNYVTFANNFGGEIQHWNGVDFTFNVPLKQGMQLRGGTSTGRTTTDTCALWTTLPELIGTTSPTPLSYCHQDTPFLTRVQVVFSYTLPKINWQVSGAFQNNPGPLVTANYVVSNAAIQPSLGRALSGGTQNVTVNLINADAQYAVYGDRYSQVDLRVTRAFRYGRFRLSPNFGAFNLTNGSAVTAYSASYATFERPQITQLGRFYRLGLQVDF